MYQKRELATARDLVHEFLRTFPSSPLWPEASLLAGYIELADCKFDDSQKWYDELVARLQPIVDEIDRVAPRSGAPQAAVREGDDALSARSRTPVELDGKKVGTDRGAGSRSTMSSPCSASIRSSCGSTTRSPACTSSPTRRRRRRGSGRTSASQVGETKVQKISTTRRSSKSSSPTRTRSSRICAGSRSRSPSRRAEIARAQARRHDGRRCRRPRRQAARRARTRRSTRRSTKAVAAADTAAQAVDRADDRRASSR